MSTPTTPLQALKESVKNLKAQFACGGSIKLDSIGHKAFLCCRSPTSPEEAQQEQSKEVLSVVNLPLTSTDVTEIHSAAVPSPHGYKGETVFDPTYRQARQITIENFAMNFNPLALKYGLLSAISQLSSTNKFMPLHAELYKLNSYATGGFFKSHRDTPKATNHIGSIVICLPSKFEGGELVVRHDGEEKTFDFKASSEKHELAWAFLFSDVEHEVLPVLSGTRITLAYDVFRQEQPVNFDATVDLRDSPLFKALENVVQAQKGAKKPLKLGIALKHAYPIDTEPSNPSAKRSAQYTKDLPGRLKGFDAEVYFTAKSLGLNVKFVAIYRTDDDDYDEDDEMDTSDDDEENDEEEGKEEKKTIPPLTSTDFYTGYYDESWDDGEARLLLDQGAKYDKSVDWIRTLEEEDEKFLGGQYLAQGNEAWIAHIYASVGIIFTVDN